VAGAAIQALGSGPGPRWRGPQLRGRPSLPCGPKHGPAASWLVGSAATTQLGSHTSANITVRNATAEVISLTSGNERTPAAAGFESLTRAILASRRAREQARATQGRESILVDLQAATRKEQRMR
jgi:hypothetical protein